MIKEYKIETNLLRILMQMFRYLLIPMLSAIVNSITRFCANINIQETCNLENMESCVLINWNHKEMSYELWMDIVILLNQTV